MGPCGAPQESCASLPLTGGRSPQHWAGFRLLAGLSAGWLCRLLGLDFGLVSAGFRLGFRLDLDFDFDLILDLDLDFDLSLILI